MCPKLLCVIDGKTLKCYDKASRLPKNLRYDRKQERGGVTEYYFRDATDRTYCVFGHDAAKIFYARLDEVDPPKINASIPITSRRPVEEKGQKTVTIIDQGRRHSFSDTDYPVVVTKHSNSV